MRISALAAGAALLAAAFPASADPIAERQGLMRERGQIMRMLAPVAQGQQPFEAAAMAEALERLHANASRTTDIDALWPEGSQTGDTKSGPRIWDERAGFQAASDAFEATVAAAVAAAPQDVDSYRSVFAPVAASCGACHESFRQ